MRLRAHDVAAAAAAAELAGIGAMVELAGEATDAGIRFTLHAPSPRVQRILEVTGLLHAWPIEEADAELN